MHRHSHHDHFEHHNHHHGEFRSTPFNKLKNAFLLTVSFMFIEAMVGWYSGSLALVADAGHMLADAAALGLAIMAQRIAAQSRTRSQTYGFRRAEVLAAFANGIALALTSIWIFKEAVERYQAPRVIHSTEMIVTATLGLIVNLVAAWMLSSNSHQNVNTRAALQHVLSDAMGSVGAMVAGIFVLTKGWNRADVIVSIFIAGLVLWGGWRLVRDTTRVLMEGSPEEVNIEHIEETIRSVPGVAEFHDLHVWSISDGFNVVTVHVVLERGFHGTDVATSVAKILHDKHGLSHATVQPEASQSMQLVEIKKPKL